MRDTRIRRNKMTTSIQESIIQEPLGFPGDQFFVETGRQPPEEWDALVNSGECIAIFVAIGRMKRAIDKIRKS